VILDLGACSECDLEVRSGIRLEFAKVGNLAILVGSGKFDIEVGMEFRKSE